MALISFHRRLADWLVLCSLRMISWRCGVCGGCVVQLQPGTPKACLLLGVAAAVVMVDVAVFH